MAGAVQLGAIIAAGVLAYLLAGAMRSFISRLVPSQGDAEVSRLGRLLRQLAVPILWVILLWLSTAILKGLGRPNDLIRVAASLLNAWIVIRVVSSIVADPFWSRTIATIAWVVAALNILRLLGPTIDLLEQAAFSVGDMRISLYLIIKVALLVTISLWIASTLARVIQARVTRSKSLTPSVQTLIVQAVRLSLLLIAVMVSLNAVGIDLTAFAVFSGAIGVGLGFGLQKIVSNFISGVIILMDRSVKPGDVIEIADTYGWVTSLGARYASVRTRDGTEHLIPNEEFIINRVVNWSHSDMVVRRKLPIGVSYDADVELAIKLVAEAVDEIPRVLKDPKPNILLRSFGDSSVDLEARYWLGDPQNGVSNVASDILRLVWKKFRENDIEIPFPQRDLHLRSGTLTVEVTSVKRKPADAA
jgi:small-conductance mechanosensitive channel